MADNILVLDCFPVLEDHAAVARGVKASSKLQGLLVIAVAELAAELCSRVIGGLVGTALWAISTPGELPGRAAWHGDRRKHRTAHGTSLVQSRKCCCM